MSVKFNAMTVDQLRSHLTERGLPTSGNKTLVERASGVTNITTTATTSVSTQPHTSDVNTTLPSFTLPNTTAAP